MGILRLSHTISWAGLEFTIYPKAASNSQQSSCVSLPSVEIADASTTPRIILVFVCLFIGAENGTQGLTHTKQLLYHLATHLAHPYFSRSQNTVSLNSNLKDFTVHVGNISKKWILLVIEGKLVNGLKTI